MRRKDFWFVNKSLILLLLLCMSGALSAQKKPTKNPLEAFLDTQFWLGLKIGMNYTQAVPETRNSGFSPIDYSADSLRKSYADFSDPGAHMGLEMNFYHRGFSASFQPAFKRMRYKYQSELFWQGAEAASRFETIYKVDQKLDVIELPLVLKYDVIRSGKIRPFVMAGGFYSIIASAQKELSIDQVDFSSGNPVSSSVPGTSISVKDAFQNFAGVAAGIGVNLDYWNIRTVFEAKYQRSLTAATVSNAQQNELASFGETNDEIFLRDINVSLSFVFPFRFIDQQFKSY